MVDCLIPAQLRPAEQVVLPYTGEEAATEEPQHFRLEVGIRSRCWDAAISRIPSLGDPSGGWRERAVRVEQQRPVCRERDGGRLAEREGSGTGASHCQG